MATEKLTAAQTALLGGRSQRKLVPGLARESVIAAADARAELRNRLNAALPTRESSPGLISEIGGLQFATGTAAVDSSAREKLARFAGIVASYPSLRFNVEGFGPSMPIGDNAPVEGRARNRRVEIVVWGDVGRPVT